jgi:hypothetical protein
MTSPTRGPTAELRERFRAGDKAGALVLAEAMLEEKPGHLEAQLHAQVCSEGLHDAYLSRLGGADRVLRTTLTAEDLRLLPIDPRIAFLISCVDGSSIEELLAVCGMPPLEALRIVFQLVEEGIIQVEDPPEAPQPSSRRT